MAREQHLTVGGFAAFPFPYPEARLDRDSVARAWLSLCARSCWDSTEAASRCSCSSMDVTSTAGERDLGDVKDKYAGSTSLACAAPVATSSHGAHAPQRTPSTSSISKMTHRQSFAENLRNVPPSPRHRHPSLTQAAVQELLNHPPSGNRHVNAKFTGREWRDISIGEIVSPDDALWIEMDSSVEEATMVRRESRRAIPPYR